MSNGDYSEMIEMPVSTCEMVIAPKKKSRFLRGRLIRSVNKKTFESAQEPTAPIAGERDKDKADPQEVAREAFADERVPTKSKVKKFAEKKEKQFKFDLVVAEVIAVFVLIVAILLTNIFWEDSGINTMIKSVFGTGTATVSDTRTAKDLAVSAPTATDGVTLDGGIMTFTCAAAVYAPASGTVSSVSMTDGVYTMTIKHSDVFKTVISGADAVYLKEGDSVYDNIPVAYAAEGTTVAMYDGGTLAADYMLDNGRIVWQS